jgi:hypothetical protein
VITTRIILDTSAVLAYASGSIHVGEVIALLAGLARALGRSDLASALLAARDERAYILTAEPEAYGEPGREIAIRI